MSSYTKTLRFDIPISEIGFNAYELKVVKGPDKGLARVFRKKEVVVGTGEDVDFVLSDPTVSRRHFSIYFDGTGLRLKDEGSRNGTFIGDLRVVQVFITKDTVLRVGSTKIKLRFKQERVSFRVSESVNFGGLQGKSFVMREVFARLKAAAASDVTVLITGESGTGKEVAARAIHEFSDRAEGPFVVFDCSATSKELMESELFGHVKGAFTNAMEDRKGAVREADGGTLFIDEVGELPLPLQAKLLRLLDKKEVKPLGADGYVKVDVRIIAATNRDLEGLVEKGEFRKDLYYRLAVLKIVMPPLRERMEDIPLLVEALLKELSVKYDVPLDGFTREEMQRLMTYSWPGNVRELKNYLETMMVLGKGIELPSQTRGKGSFMGYERLLDMPYHQAKELLITDFDRQYFSRLLQENGGNISRAARAAGIHRKTLEYILKKLSLRYDKNVRD